MRRVDYVLAYELDDEVADADSSKRQDEEISESKKLIRREFFQTMLEVQGMQLEIVDAKVDYNPYKTLKFPRKTLSMRRNGTLIALL